MAWQAVTASDVGVGESAGRESFLTVGRISLCQASAPGAYLKRPLGGTSRCQIVTTTTRKLRSSCESTFFYHHDVAVGTAHNSLSCSSADRLENSSEIDAAEYMVSVPTTSTNLLFSHFAEPNLRCQHFRPYLATSEAAVHNYMQELC